MASEWEQLQKKLKERFEGEMDVDAILFMIGLQELGKPYQRYKKDQKLEIMHVAICTVLEPFGFYEFKGRDEVFRPDYEVPVGAMIDYFKREGFI